MDPHAVDGVSTRADPPAGLPAVPAVPDEYGRPSGELLDCRSILNARTPDGVEAVFEWALASAASYPADDYAAFRRAGAEHVGCRASQVVPTAGRRAGIRLAMEATVSAGDDVLVPTHARGGYVRETRLNGGEPTVCAREELHKLDPAPFGLVVARQPDDRTGEAYDPDRLRAYAERCREAGTPLLVDESLLGFTTLPSLAGTPGVIVVRSLAAICGLPALRAGFLVATDGYRDRLDTARLTWGLGAPGSAVGTYCMGRSSFFDETRTRTRQERERMADRLGTRFEVTSSAGPVLLVELPSTERVDDLLSTLQDAGILVQDARQFRGLDRHVRLTVRTAQDNERLLEAFEV